MNPRVLLQVDQRQKKCPISCFSSQYLTNANQGGEEVFVAKLTDMGPTSSFVWAQQANGTASDIPRALAAVGNNLYVTGSFQGATARFGNTVLTNATPPDTDVFVAKMVDAGQSGAFVWAQQAGGPGHEWASALVASGSNVFVAGTFTGVTTAFNSIVLPNSNSRGGTNDLFVAKLIDAGASGNFMWATAAGGPGSDQARTLSLSSADTLIVGGSVVVPATFGRFTLPGAGPAPTAFVASLTNNLGLSNNSPTSLIGMQLSPNPAHTTATVQLPAIPGAATATLTLLDALGRTLRTQTASPNARAELDLTGLAPGLYAVRVAAGAATATQRLVVE